MSKLDRYPIPKVSDLFAQLGKRKFFLKLDLNNAYQQVPLEEESKKYITINTHMGLFTYTRLPFGIAWAPGIFQRVIESLLQGIEGVIVYLDDILVTGITEEAHLRVLYRGGVVSTRTGRPPSEAKQVHEILCDLPIYRCRGSAHPGRASESHCRRTRTQFSQQVVLGHGILLQQVSPKFILNPTPTVSPLEEEHTMGVEG